MNRILIILTLSIIGSCTDKTYDVESRFENGNYEVIYRPLTDTTIYDRIYTRKYKVKFNKNKDTLRRGLYINEMALGDHFFYENNLITCIRNYVVPNPFFLDIDSKNETVDFSDFQIRSDSTYLNTAMFFDKNGDSIPYKSHFYTSKFRKNKWAINDSVEVDFEFFFSSYEVIKSDLYFIVPEDTSMVSLGLNGDNDYTF